MRSCLDAALGAKFALAVILVVAAADTCRAQTSFGFSISSGGHRHHHGHHHHHHPRWGFSYGIGPWCPGWYAPPAVVYAPAPVVQERVIYVQPSPSPPPVVVSPYSSSSTLKANPTVAADRPPTLATTPVTDDRIVIRNSAGVSLPVAFVVDGQDVELADGGVRTFVGRSQRTVQYDRGGKFGSTQQDLTAGQYEFRITPSGWDLVRRPEIAASRTAVRSNALPESR